MCFLRSISAFAELMVLELSGSVTVFGMKDMDIFFLRVFVPLA